jgi:Double zinc ribbon
MKCPRCQQENRPGAKFCEECAAPLARACVNCGAQLSASAKFCSECAYPAGPAVPPAPQRFGAPDTYTPRHLAERIINSKAALEGERKQVTVLFADLKGSMELLADREFSGRGLDALVGQGRQAVGLALARGEGAEDRAAADAQDVGENGGEFDVRVLQGFLDAQGVLSDLADELFASAGEIAQLLDRRRRDEAAPDEAVSEQVSQVASFTSLFRPGMLRMCMALARTSSKWPSRTCHTGFQYTPLDSMAT